MSKLRVHAPGRINIIGEHTDYTGGLVMPAAIRQGITFNVERNGAGVLRLFARDLEERAEVSLPVTGKTGRTWVDYLVGITFQFQELGHDVPGLTIDFGGDLPQGAGVSSSAALEGGMAFLLNEITGAGLSRPELAKLCQRSSNNFMGIPSGIMDQFASLNGVAEGPILLDCHTLDFTPVNASLPGYSWVLINSNVTHDLSEGAYHDRVRECATALAAIQEKFPLVDRLSAASPAQVSAVADQLNPTVLRRAAFVTHENQRVRDMAKVLGADAGARSIDEEQSEEANGVSAKALAVGDLLNATHAGLRDDYEVSCAEIDFLQRWATETFAGEVTGSRIMGGGFGGCTLNLVRAGDLERLRAEVVPAYEAAFGITATMIEVEIGAGARVVGILGRGLPARPV